MLNSLKQYILRSQFLFVAATSLIGSFASVSLAGECDQFSVVPSPNPGSRGNFLNAIDSAGPGAIWAVGHNRVPGVPSITSDTLPLALNWNGSAWSISPLPALPAPANGPNAYLNGVAVLSPDDVWAVGGANPPDELQKPQTLVFHFDGSNWEKIPSPVAHPNNSGSFFNDVAGVSSDDLWAVGEMNENFLAAHFDGSNWTQTPVPPGDLENQELRALSVIDSDDVWAAGGTGEGAAQPIIVHWDGSSWGTPIPHPPQSQYNGLWDVIAFSMNDIWVAANRVDVQPAQQVFLHWDGSSWTSYAAPQFHSARYVGTSNDLYSVAYNEVMHWDGSSWSQVATLEPFMPFGGFNDAVQLENGTIIGVGRTEAGDEAQTLSAMFEQCAHESPADLDDDGSVSVPDLLQLLASWGTCAQSSTCPADLDGDGSVGVSDLLLLLQFWS